MIFDRQILSRILCIVAALCWLLLMLVLPIFVVLIFGNGDASWFDTLLPIALIASVASVAAIGVLWLWRRCDQCQRRLFSDARERMILPASEQIGASRLGAWLNATMAPERHFRARKFLGSYRSRAVLDYVLRGHTRCQWCNHDDQARPNYRVISGDR